MRNKLVLKFPQSLLDKPIISTVVKRFDLDFNILHAQTKPEGLLILEISGTDENYNAAIKYLENLKVNMQPLSKDIIRDENKCTNCSACIPHCPTQSLFIEDRKTMKVGFDPEKCIACEACIPVCPYKAMSLKL
ncbi:MAG: 4Fe-4S binding protein [Nanoarchaeota archaeon]|nr:4Fe-4S binding protein [Nanoarchaeota archaeon]